MRDQHCYQIRKFPAMKLLILPTSLTKASHGYVPMLECSWKI